MTAFSDGNELMCADNVQHITMYLFFLILNIISLLEFYCCTPLPSIVDALFGFAFGVETILLYFHTHGQGMVEQHLHKLLTFASFMCSLTSFLAGICKRNIIIQLSKPLFVLLQGSWFIHIAFSLYPIFTIYNKSDSHPHHEVNNLITTLNSTANLVNQTIEKISTEHHHHDHQNEHRAIMINTAYFCWYFAFAILTLFTLAIIARKKFYKKEVTLNEKYQRLLEETST